MRLRTWNLGDPAAFQGYSRAAWEPIWCPFSLLPLPSPPLPPLLLSLWTHPTFAKTPRATSARHMSRRMCVCSEQLQESDTKKNYAPPLTSCSPITHDAAGCFALSAAEITHQKQKNTHSMKCKVVSHVNRQAAESDLSFWIFGTDSGYLLGSIIRMFFNCWHSLPANKWAVTVMTSHHIYTFNHT